MLNSERNKLAWLWLILLACIISRVCVAAGSGVVVRQASLATQNSHWELTAEIDFQLSHTATKALQSGIPLSWEVRIIVQRQRSFIWDETLCKDILPFRIRYHPLRNVYEVADQKHAIVKTYSGLSAALDSLGQIRARLPFGDLSSRNDLVAGIKVQFDRESLPIPLRPEAYFKSGWDLSSTWYYWKLQQKNNHSEKVFSEYERLFKILS